MVAGLHLRTPALLALAWGLLARLQGKLLRPYRSELDACHRLSKPLCQDHWVQAWQDAVEVHLYPGRSVDERYR